MNSLVLILITLACFSMAYLFYGRFMAKHFAVDPQRKTPAHTNYDGIDYVPAKNWWVLFGHHFSSICGAGPIVGPALAVAYWGWGVSAVWIVIGGIFMGAVSDFSALIMSVKSEGQSIAKISGDVLTPRVRLYFSIFLWISLILVIAVFAIFASKTLIEEPRAVLPSFGLIPVALWTGWLLYQKKMNNWFATGLGLGSLVLLLIAGTFLPIEFENVGPFSAQTFWILLLLTYCFFASVAPVQVLLQPRDYLASFILFSLIAIGILSIFISQPVVDAPAFSEYLPSDWPKAGPLWPMLFVTIACGAISGFHSLVSSGTTCKQIATESHACRIGYGGMLIESTVAMLVVIAVSAGLKQAELTSLLKTSGPIAAFSHGYGNLSRIFLGDYGSSFAVVALNAFILTTLDSATRITRYITSELFGIKNIYLATGIVVVAGGFLALTGQWSLLWPAFGASNQLIAGIVLMIAACWLLARGKSYRIVIIPAFFMILTTLAAFAFQWQRSLGKDWLMVGITSLLILMSISIMIETVKRIRSLRSVAN